MNILKEVGENVRFYRKKKNMSLEELAQVLGKSKSCLSKYERGNIAMDITALYEIASALDVKVTQLLYHPIAKVQGDVNTQSPSFFSSLNTFYLYYFDGRINKIVRCVADILEKMEDGSFECQMYMNIQDYTSYHQCENVYHGVITHYSSMSVMILQNQNMIMDQYQLAIPNTCMNADTKWGLAFGISSRPLMPTSAKLLISKEIQKETQEFKKSLLISKEDIRLLKLYNMLTIL